MRLAGGYAGEGGEAQGDAMPVSDFLKQAQKERAQEKTQQDFEKAARDPSWQRAFNRAAQREAVHEHEIERDDPGKSR